MEGWIRLYRKIKLHWLWEEKRRFSRFEAWVDCLLRANHKDTRVALGNELIEVKRGSFITSIRKLAEEWGWSNTKVISFFKLLEHDEMLVHKSDNKKTVVTIINYDFYQNPNDTEETETERKNDAKTTQKHTDNNVNNEKKNSNISQNEKDLLSVLKSVENYPFDYEKDLQMIRNLMIDFPKLDITYQLKRWAAYKLDKPLVKKSNPRSQLRNWFEKAEQWRKKDNPGDRSNQDATAATLEYYGKMG